MTLPFQNEKIKKWNSPQTLTIREWCFNREFSSKTFRIQQIPGILFSPRASFSRHPQYTPAPSVSAYRACSKLFAAPSIEHDRLYPSRSPHAVTRAYRFVTRNSDKNQKNFLLQEHLSLESASTPQISQPLFQQKFQFFQIQHARRTWSSEKMISLLNLTYFVFFKRELCHNSSKTSSA
jgi:hypothetical protein